MGVVCFSVLRGLVCWLVICSNNRCSVRGAERHVTEAVCENDESSKYDCCVSVGHDSVFTLHHKLLYGQDNSYYTELFRDSLIIISFYGNAHNVKMNPWPVLLLTLIHCIDS